MRLMVISDIHGSNDFLKKALEIFISEEFDKLLILGDIMYHGPRNPIPPGYAPAEVANQLNKIKEKIIAIRGNCDSEVDQMLLEFPIMESYKQLFFNDTELFITHGHNYSPDDLPKNINKNTIFCFGHTHIPEIYTKDNLYILNPGSITLPKGESANSYAVITDNEIAICNLEKVTTKKLQLF